ncbi:thioredoxin domain-containing protein [Candidatus Bathycorpusculum sp.]|uniref:thioredoxin domain-containing protein n=1 Tax=Candidatus Bathycorpusculum sp. TaxID=2994959 RepID=UPI0028193015|nr:thioredoxin domain-containing protein [Candidatus Termitimicrobium sp.]MCL2686509.1 thioredoxin domain-containing protein [Candidatus Termitimicrobium sp.]
MTNNQVKNEQDIEALLESKDRVYALFYATWCPFSQRFLPLFSQYTKTNPDECLSIPIDFEPKIVDKYDIKYYPTLLLLKKGRVQKRLDATPGIGLNKEQLDELTASA